MTQIADLYRPGPDAATILSVYEFALANDAFCSQLISSPAANKTQATPFSLFLSLASYLYSHAYRTVRVSLYAYLMTTILLIMVEDPSTAKQLCEIAAPVRLCRQRSPYLPISKGERPYAASVIDALIDSINHNLLRRLNTGLYMCVIFSPST